MTKLIFTLITLFAAANANAAPTIAEFEGIGPKSGDEISVAVTYDPATAHLQPSTYQECLRSNCTGGQEGSCYCEAYGPIQTYEYFTDVVGTFDLTIRRNFDHSIFRATTTGKFKKLDKNGALQAGLVEFQIPGYTVGHILFWANVETTGKNTFSNLTPYSWTIEEVELKKIK